MLWELVGVNHDTGFVGSPHDLPHVHASLIERTDCAGQFAQGRFHAGPT